jgi:hypothetical protein
LVGSKKREKNPKNKMIMFRKSFTIILFSILMNDSAGQSIGLNGISDDIYESVLNRWPETHLSCKPFSYKQIIKADSIIDQTYFPKSRYSIFNNYTFRTDKEHFTLHIEPIIDAKLKIDNGNPKSGSLFKAGCSAFYKYKDRFYLSADLFVARNDRAFTDLIAFDGQNIILHYGRPLVQNNKGYEFISFTGDVCYNPNDYIAFHIGRGKHFLGIGKRSLFLSDNGNASPYFKVVADIWKIKYLWMIVKLKDVQVYGAEKYPDLYNKAVFIHYLDLNLTKNINFNFFEAVVSSPYDREGLKSGYDAGYFNPVIFYRPVEFYSGSSDNSLMGAGLNIRLFKSVFLYSQFILDDLVISRVNDGSGWWGNKYGIQTGIKGNRMFNNQNFFFRTEFNKVSPYTFSHGESYIAGGIANLNYGTYCQALAHPTGANFWEIIVELKYRKGRFFGELKFVKTEKGLDFINDSLSYGGDIYRSYNNRTGDFGVKFLQGSRIDFTYISPSVSYMLNPNWGLLFTVDAEYRLYSPVTQSLSGFSLMFGLNTLLFDEDNDYLEL